VSLLWLMSVLLLMSLLWLMSRIRENKVTSEEYKKEENVLGRSYVIASYRKKNTVRSDLVKK
jgi:hypothetical protein